MLRAVFSLLGVLCAVVLILVLAWWTTRALGSAQGGGTLGGLMGMSGDPAFAVLAQLGLGRGARLVLVRLGERCCLFGVTEQQITLIRELEPSEGAHWLEGQQRPAPSGFLDVLSETLRKGKQA